MNQGHPHFSTLSEENSTYCQTIKFNSIEKNSKEELIWNSNCRKAIGRPKLILHEDWLDDTWLKMKSNGGTDLPPVVAIMAL